MENYVDDNVSRLVIITYQVPQHVLKAKVSKFEDSGFSSVSKYLELALLTQPFPPKFFETNTQRMRWLHFCNKVLRLLLPLGGRLQVRSTQDRRIVVMGHRPRRMRFVEP